MGIGRRAGVKCGGCLRRCGQLTSDDLPVQQRQQAVRIGKRDDSTPVDAPRDCCPGAFTVAVQHLHARACQKQVEFGR